MNAEVSNPLPPKLTFQINLEGSGVLYILWASRERVAESKYVENFAVLLVQCNWRDKIASITVEWQPGLWNIVIT